MFDVSYNSFEYFKSLLQNEIGFKLKDNFYSLINFVTFCDILLHFATIFLQYFNTI